MVSPVLPKDSQNPIRSSQRIQLLGISSIAAGMLLLCWHGFFLLSSDAPSSSVAIVNSVALAVTNSEEFESGVELPPQEELALYRSRIRGGQPLDLAYATSLVHDATRHDDFVEITIQENWLQWTLGRFYSPLRRIQDSERLLAHGGGNCSERAQILKTICDEGNYPSRFVGLGGHVVLEVFCDGFWQIADADYGVHFPSDLSEWQSDESTELVRAKLSTEHKPERIDNYLRILHSTDDNSILSVGSALSPRLHMIEEACKYGAWIIPLLSAVLGIGLIVWRSLT